MDSGASGDRVRIVLLAKVLPVALAILGVSMIVLGGWLKPPASLDKKSLATAAA